MRKRLAASAVAISLAAAVIAVSGGGVASADPGNGATILKGFPCYISLSGVYAWTYDQSIQVDSSSGNIMLRCNFRPDDIVSGSPPSQTVKVTGWGCSTYAGSTTDTLFVMNPRGVGVIVCQIKAH